ncbi:hypothetical protein [Variovorax sp. PBS-H4]|uniref:hypothetical protein n=1 Tax=Variovorax sp. PBS-H4 TaxID=434008 RepID=UPI0013A52BAF|nr:hypothetical protein [Variovorax sp. PBS-H4]
MGLGLLVDRGINLVLTEFEKVIIVVNESKVIDNTGKKNAIKAEIKKLALEARLDERLEKLKFAATLLMNDEFLSALPKEKRVPLGILGINMANLVRTFEKPDGPYQSLRRVLDEAVKNPDKFIEWAQKVKKPGETEQLPEQMVENNADASASQEQIEF